jgi:glycosyltransferase involved in cell wall biosynthesis
MNSIPTISILMPVKNTAPFLIECLESIINQTETDFELIAIDDHSTDESYSILKKYSIKDKRVKVFKNTGNGIIEALRLAYSKSSGTYITRMDSDDVMSLTKLQVLTSNLMAFGSGHIAVGKVQYFSATPLGAGFIKYEEWLNSLIEEGSNFEGIYKECVIPSPCWMVYREDLEKCNAFYPNVYPEDYDLAFRFYKGALKPIASHEILHHWRDYATRTSRTHVHYADHTFLAIKMDYFLKLDCDVTKNLVLWGAGDKGKKAAKILIAQNIKFTWICDNPKKIGKDIYGQILYPLTALDTIENSQSIITVANLKAQKEIKLYFKERNLISNKDYFFFC